MSETRFGRILGAEMLNVSRDIETMLCEPTTKAGDRGMKLSLTLGAQISVYLPREDARALAEFILQQTEED